MNTKTLRERIRKSRNQSLKTARTTRFPMNRERSLGRVAALERVLAIIDDARRKAGAE